MNNLQISLPGTHGYAFPWDPPHFGIPAPVLSDLADKLKDIVVDMAVEAAVAEVRSRQSSPTGSFSGTLGTVSDLNVTVANITALITTSE